jgi:F-type H+-transporting ATPase subunit epsilon
MTMRVAVVSPEQSVWDGEATMVIARTLDGEIGILEGHVPLLGVLAEDGEVRIESVDSGEITLQVSGGFLSVTKDGVSVLAEKASFHHHTK